MVDYRTVYDLPPVPSSWQLPSIDGVTFRVGPHEGKALLVGHIDDGTHVLMLLDAVLKPKKAELAGFLFSVKDMVRRYA